MSTSRRNFLKFDFEPSHSPDSSIAAISDITAIVDSSVLPWEQAEETDTQSTAEEVENIVAQLNESNPEAAQQVMDGITLIQDEENGAAEQTKAINDLVLQDPTVSRYFRPLSPAKVLIATAFLASELAARNTKSISRRTFLRLMWTLAVVGCMPEPGPMSPAAVATQHTERGYIEDSSTFEGNETATSVGLNDLYNQIREDGISVGSELEQTLGNEWKQIVTEHVFETSEQIGTGQAGSSLTPFIAAAAMSGNEAIRATAQNSVKAMVLGQGDPVLGRMAASITELGHQMNLPPVLFYSEPTKGGFVVLDRNTNTWYKFFRHLGPLDQEMSGYYNQAIHLWKHNAGIFGMLPENEMGKIDIRTTVVKDNPYVVYRTPHFGDDTVEKLLLSGQISKEQGKQSVLTFFRRSLEHIKAGNLQAVHWDPNPGNIVINRYIGPIDFDVTPLAFQDEEIAARAYAKRLFDVYSRDKNPLAHTFTVDDLERIMLEVFGKEMKVLSGPKIGSATIKLPHGGPSGGSFKIKYYFDHATLKGARLNQFVDDIAAQMTSGVVPAKIDAVATIRGTQKTVPVRFNTPNTVIQPHKVAPWRRTAMSLIDNARPFVRAGAVALNVLAIIEVARDISEQISTPMMKIHKSADQSIMTENLTLNGSFKQFAEAFSRSSWKLAEDIMKQNQNGFDMPVAGYEELCGAIRDFEEVTGIPLTQRGVDSYPKGNIEDETYVIGMRMHMIGLIQQVLLDSGTWNAVRIDGFSPVPFFPYQHVQNNLAIKYQNLDGARSSMTFAAYSDTQSHPQPIFEVTYDKKTGMVTDIFSYTETNDIKVDYGVDFDASAEDALDTNPWDERDLNLNDPAQKADLIRLLNERGLELFLRKTN